MTSDTQGMWLLTVIVLVWFYQILSTLFPQNWADGTSEGTPEKLLAKTVHDSTRSPPLATGMLGRWLSPSARSDPIWMKLGQSLAWNRWPSSIESPLGWWKHSRLLMFLRYGWALSQAQDITAWGHAWELDWRSIPNTLELLSLVITPSPSMQMNEFV